MKLIRTVLLSTAAGIAAAVTTPTLCAQEPSKEPAAPAKPPAAPAQAKTLSQLIDDLGSESYRTRTEAERALRQKGDEAVAELRQAAEHSDDAEVQWRARRVLRQIERGGDAQLQQRRDRGADDQDDQRPPFAWRGQGGGDPVRDQFESLFERFERDFGIDIPRARFFSDNFFQDLQQQMKTGATRSQAMSMQIGPDGAVRVEVEEKGEDGKGEKKVYEAPDMESFQQKYPDVLRRNGLGMGLFPGGGSFFHDWTQPGHAPRVLQWRGGNGQDPVLQFTPNDFQRWRTLLPQQGEPGEQDDVMEAMPVEPPAPPPAGKRLGVTIRDEIPAGVREYVGLDDGVGLWVESVQDDSLAEALGVQQGDIVVKIGTRAIGSPQDVQQALGAIDKGETVTVELLRKGQRKTVTAAKTEAVVDGAAKREGAKEGGDAPAKRERAERPAKQAEQQGQIR